MVSHGAIPSIEGSERPCRIDGAPSSSLSNVMVMKLDYYRLSGTVTIITPITSFCLKSCFGLSGCALWQPMQA